MNLLPCCKHKASAPRLEGSLVAPNWAGVVARCAAEAEVRRREILADTLGQVEPSQAVLFDGIVQQGHEGVMVKHLAGHYLPGKRSIKPTVVFPCVLIGCR